MGPPPINPFSGQRPCCHTTLCPPPSRLSLLARSHNPPPSGPSILTSIRFLLQSMWDHQSTPLEASILAVTPPRVLPLRVLASSLAHYPVLGSDTNCNSLSPPLTDIILFVVSLSGFPSRFLEHVC